MTTNVITYLPQPSVKSLSISELVAKISRKEINANPVGQRISTDSKLFKKSNGIIISILEGSDIGEITVIEKPDGSWIVIDGGHRSRAIFEFINGTFALPKNSNIVLKDTDGNHYELSGKKFSDLPKIIKEYFFNYELRLCVYTNLSSVQETKIFRNRNQSTPVNHQEMMNAASDNLVAIFVRETVREIPDHTPEYQIHNLFKIDYYKKKPLMLSYENSRLCWDEFVAILCIYSLQGKIVNAGYPEIENLYDKYGDEVTGILAKDPKKLNSMTKEVNQCLNFLEKVSSVLNRRMGSSASNSARIVMATRYYFYLKSQGEVKIHDYERFCILLANSLYDLVGKTGSQPLPPKEKWEQRAVDSSLTKDVNFNSVASKMREWMSGYHAEAPKVLQTVLWLEEAMIDRAEMFDGDIGVTLKDSKRSLSLNDRQYLLGMQNFKCYVDDKDLDLSEAAAGHLIAHCNGGKTTIENCRMIRKIYNSESGSMDLDIYRTHKRKELGLDA